MNWSEYFIKLAETTALKSKDPTTQVGCVIADMNNRVVSLGYNGFISKCNESLMTFERPLKSRLTCHAESNAILFAQKNLDYHTLYCTHGPCPECLKLILQSGIRKVTYKDPSVIKDRGTQEDKNIIRMLIDATSSDVRNINGQTYLNELGVSLCLC